MLIEVVCLYKFIYISVSKFSEFYLGVYIIILHILRIRSVMRDPRALKHCEFLLTAALRLLPATDKCNYCLIIITSKMRRSCREM